MKTTIIVSLLVAGGFALGLIVSITLSNKDQVSPDLYAHKEIPLNGYKSY